MRRELELEGEKRGGKKVKGMGKRRERRRKRVEG